MKKKIIKTFCFKKKKEAFLFLIIGSYGCSKSNNEEESVDERRNLVEDSNGVLVPEDLDLDVYISESSTSSPIIIKSSAQDDFIALGTGDDIVYSGQGKDSIKTGDGDDYILILGERETDEYEENDVEDMLNTILSFEDDLNIRSVSDIFMGESIDGGGGEDTLIVYGDADFTKAKVNNVENIRFYSQIIFNPVQLLSFREIIGDGCAVLQIKAPSATHIENLSFLTFQDVSHLKLGSNVTVNINSLEDIASLLNLSLISGITEEDAGTINFDLRSLRMTEMELKNELSSLSFGNINFEINKEGISSLDNLFLPDFVVCLSENSKEINIAELDFSVYNTIVSSDSLDLSISDLVLKLANRLDFERKSQSSYQVVLSSREDSNDMVKILIHLENERVEIPIAVDDVVSGINIVHGAENPTSLLVDVLGNDIDDSPKNSLEIVRTSVDIGPSDPVSFSFQQNQIFLTVKNSARQPFDFSYQVINSYGFTDEARVFLSFVHPNISARISLDPNSETDLVEGTNRMAQGVLLIEDDNGSAEEFFTPQDNIRLNYGNFNLRGSGQWTYSLIDSATQFIREGQEVVERINVTSVDNTSFSFSINIRGIDQAIEFSSGEGVSFATANDTAIKDEGILASGRIEFTNPDASDRNLQFILSNDIQQNESGDTYGSLRISTNGNWSFFVRSPEEIANFNSLQVGDLIVRTFTLNTNGEESARITINIQGADDDTIVAVGENYDSFTILDTSLTNTGESFSASFVFSDVDTSDILLVEDTIEQNESGTRYFSSFRTVASSGKWVAEFNENIDILQAGETVTLSFDLELSNGVSHTISIKIMGANDRATFLGDNRLTINETENSDEGLTFSGNLVVSDLDNGNQFVASTISQNEIGDSYGTFSITNLGDWTFVTNNNFDSLREHQSVQRSFTVHSEDLTTHTVVIVLNGADDLGLFIGDLQSTLSDTADNDVSLSSRGYIIYRVDDPSISFDFVGQDISLIEGGIDYGRFVIDTDGAWVFTGNRNINFLDNGEQVEFSIDINLSGTDIDSTNVTITIDGADEGLASSNAVITGNFIVNIQEDIISAQGNYQAQFSITDPDSGENVFASLNDIADYGTFNVLSNGLWSYLLNQSVNFIREGETLTDRFYLRTFDGGVELVTLNIIGQNDVAIITGTDKGEIFVDSSQAATGFFEFSGSVTVTDADEGEGLFQAFSDVAGSYGSFTLSESGDWSYRVASNISAIQGLSEDEHGNPDVIIDSITVQTIDGTSTELEVKISANLFQNVVFNNFSFFQRVSRANADPPEETRSWHEVHNIVDVWEDYSGDGVNVIISDTFIDYNHPDLIGQFHLDIQYHDIFIGKDANFFYKAGHGTPVAGVIGAARNEEGIAGVAYDAQLFAYSGFGELLTETRFSSLDIADNRRLMFTMADVINFSWFNLSPFYNVDESNYDYIWSDLRNNLGLILVTSGGNERSENQESGIFYHKILRRSISIAGLQADSSGQLYPATERDGITIFSSLGSNLLVSALGRSVETLDDLDEPDAETLDDDYYSSYNGTSFASPIVAGIVALALEANSALGWRDIRDLLLLTARRDSLTTQSLDFPNNWVSNSSKLFNGGGGETSRNYGFGVVDALGVVRLAEDWTRLRSARTSANEISVSGTSSTSTAITAGGKTTVSISIGEVEVEQITLSLHISNAFSSDDLRITLVSPSGTRIVLYDRHNLAPGNGKVVYFPDREFSLSSAFFYGEEGEGDWNLEIDNFDGTASGDLHSARLQVFGANAATQTSDIVVITNEFSTNAVALIDEDGGSDTINAAAVSDNVKIDLSNNSSSSIGNKALAIADASFENAVGGDGDDTLIGNSSSNLLIGGRGDDILYASTGNDILDGKQGKDTVSYEGITNAISISLSTNVATKSATETDTLLGIENIIGTNFNDIIVGDDNDNVLEGLGGADSFNGGGGNDWVSYQESTAGVTVNLSNVSENTGDAQGDTFVSIENIIGTRFNDTLIGDGNDNIFDAGEGIDSFDGKGGNDWVSYQKSTEAVTVDLSNALKNTGDAEGDTITNIGNIIGTEFNDELIGDGNDNIFDGFLGRDTFNGGEGNDTVVFRFSSEEIDVDLSDEGQFTSIENIEGTDLNDVIVGSDSNNIIKGLDGNDKITLGASGSDIIEGNEGRDTLILSNQTSGITIDLNETSFMRGTETVSFSGMENIEGSEYDDTITGDDTRNFLVGGGGNNTLNGGGGNDIILANVNAAVSIVFEGNNIINGNNGSDTIIVYPREGYLQTISGGLGYDVIVNVSKDNLNVNFFRREVKIINADNSLSSSLINFSSIEGIETGDGNDDIVGNNLRNFIYCGDGDDTVDAGGGNDKVIVGKGTNSLNGGGGIDEISFLQLNRSVQLDMSTNTASSIYGSNSLSNFEKFIFTDRSDTVTADGSEGMTYELRSGHDTFHFSAFTNSVANGGEGLDTINFSSLINAVMVDLELDTVSSGSSSATFEDFENVVGTNQDDTLNGNEGNNILTGGLGNDRFFGKGGFDQFFDDMGSDTYVFEGAFGVAEISDTQGTNTIMFNELIAGLNFRKKLVDRDGDASNLKNDLELRVNGDNYLYILNWGTTLDSTALNFSVIDNNSGSWDILS